MDRMNNIPKKVLINLLNNGFEIREKVEKIARIIYAIVKKPVYDGVLGCNCEGAPPLSPL